jgi:8-oxo-dGTP pyrophosphatase MutT (NUDIX family)
MAQQAQQDTLPPGFSFDSPASPPPSSLNDLKAEAVKQKPVTPPKGYFQDASAAPTATATPTPPAGYFEDTEAGESPGTKQLHKVAKWATTPLIPEPSEKTKLKIAATLTGSTPEKVAQEHPIALGVGEGVLEFGRSLSEPLNIATIAGGPIIGSTGEALNLSPRVIQGVSAALSGVFAAQAAHGTYKDAKTAYQAYLQGNNRVAAESATNAALNLGAALFAGKHAVKGGYEAFKGRMGESLSGPEIVEPPDEGAPPSPPPGGGGGGGDLEEQIRLARQRELEETRAIQDRKAKHAEVSAAVRRDLEQVLPEDRQAVLDELNQRGKTAYDQGNLDAAGEAAHHAWVMEQIMQEALPQPAPQPVVSEVPPEEEPPAPATPIVSSDPRLAPRGGGGGGAPSAAPQRGAPVAVMEREEAPEAESVQGTLFSGAPEVAEPVEEPTKTVGETAAEIERMDRQAILDELGVKEGSFDAKQSKKRLAKLLALKRAGEKKPASATAGPQPITPKAAAKKPSRKAAAEQAAADRKLADHFTPGNVIFNDYWKNYDKVLQFEPSAEGEPWKVQVIGTDVDGNPRPGERPRWHFTYPDSKDTVVSRAPQAAPATPILIPTSTTPPATTQTQEPGLVDKVAKEVSAKKRGAKREKVAAAPETAPVATETVQPPPPAPVATPVIEPEAPVAEQPATPSPNLRRQRLLYEEANRKLEESKRQNPNTPSAYRAQAGAVTKAFNRLAKQYTNEFPQDTERQGLADWLRKKPEDSIVPPVPEEAVAAEPETPAPTPAAAPTPPTPAPTAKPITVNRLSGMVWEVPGTDYTIHYLGDDKFDVRKGGEPIGTAPSVGDAKAQIQAHQASAWEAPTPGELGATARANKARREALTAAAPPTGPDTAVVKNALTKAGLHDRTTARVINQAVKKRLIQSPEQLSEVLQIANAIRSMDPKVTKAAAVIEASQFDGLAHLEATAAAKEGDFPPGVVARARQVWHAAMEEEADPYVSAARVAGGKVKMGADPKALAEVLGSSLYGKDPATVVTKELTQNAWDALRPATGAKEINIRLDHSENTVTVSDTGLGMTEQELVTVFTDLGRTGKLTQVDASGGFGIAKAAPFMMPESLTVTTVVKEGGKFLEHSFVSTPKEIVGKGVEIHTRELPSHPEPQTGTVIKAKFAADTSLYYAEKFARQSQHSINPPGTLKVSNGYGDDSPAAAELGTAPLVVAKATGAKLSLYASPETRLGTGGKYSGLKVEVNNNGIYQFDIEVHPPAKDMKLPARVAVNVQAIVRERHPDYPFQANREAFRNAEVESKVRDLVKEHIFREIFNQRNREISAAIRDLPTINIGATEIPIFDSGKRLTPVEIEQLQTDPAFIDLVHTIHQLTQAAIARLSTEKLPTIRDHYGQVVDLNGLGSKIKKIGMVFSDTLHGVHITDPTDADNTLLFVNPFSFAQNSTSTARAASTVWHTIKHEIIHDKVKGHNETFTSAEAIVAGALGSRSELASIQELEDVYADTDNPGAIRPDLNSALQLYADSRGRPETVSDLFRGEGLDTGEHGGAEGGAGDEGRLRPSPEGTLPEHVQPLRAKKGPGTVTEVKTEAEAGKPDWLQRGVQEFIETRGGRFSVAPEVAPDVNATDIADAYDAMKHEPDSPAVKASYEALKKDHRGIDAQWDYATKKLGITFEPWNKPGQPYANSAEMKADVDNNKHLYFFRGGEMPADHPMVEVDPKTGYTYNEKMRAIHDLFGHAMRGHQFGAKGEENAWADHSQAFSPAAIPALTTETRGQNSWVNYGPQMRRADGTLIKKGDPDWIHPSNRKYAENKAGLLPQRFHYRQDAPLVLVSPNTFNLNVTQAEAQLKTRLHKQFAQQAHQLAQDMGLNVTIEHSLGSWKGGAENSIAIRLPFGTDPDLVKFYEAQLGRLGFQFATGSFTPSPEGKDHIYHFWVDKNISTGTLAKALLNNDIGNSTIVPVKDGYGVTLVGNGDELDERVTNLAKELELKNVRRNRGVAEFPGSEIDRPTAERFFLGRSQDIEQRRPSLGLGAIRRRWESRPDYKHLYNELRSAKEPSFVEVTHGSRTPELVQIDPAFHGKGPQGGGESKRKTAFPEYWVDRSYFQIEGTPGERPYSTYIHQYEGVFNRENLYNFSDDPDNLKAKIPDRLRGSEAGFSTYYEKLIHDAGYDGYYSPERGTVAAFSRTPVEQRLKAGEVKLPAAGEPTEGFTKGGHWAGAGNAASGVLLISEKTGRIGLPLRGPRVHTPNKWGTVGGAVQRGMTPEESARAEVAEETGYTGPMEMIPAHVFEDRGFKYHNFIGIVPEEFPYRPEPHAAWETQRFQWFDPEEIKQGMRELPSQYHPGLIELFSKSGDQIENALPKQGPGPIEQVKAEAKRKEPKPPRGSTVPLMQSVLLPRYKVIEDIGGHLEDYTRKTLDELEPGKTSVEHRVMVNRAVRILRDELKYQLAQENSGADWYKGDIKVLLDEMKKLHPELDDLTNERMFLLHVAATSPGKTAAFENVNVAEQAYSLYKKDGVIPETQEDGTPWGVYGPAPLRSGQGLLRYFKGDVAKAMEWMLTKHPLKEVEDVKARSGYSRNNVKKALPPDYDPDAVYGAYILGEKVGPFFMNLNGISTELTVDRWFMRTWNRLMGTLIGPNPKTGELQIQDVPRGKHERAAMVDAIDRLREEFGLETSQVQAALWYYEQGLYSRLGQRGMFGGTYATAAKDVYDLRSKGHASRGEADAQERKDAFRGGAGGGAGPPAEGVRPEDTEGEGVGRTGELFGDTSFDPGEFGEPKVIPLKEAQAIAKRQTPREKLAASRKNRGQ